MNIKIALGFMPTIMWLFGQAFSQQFEFLEKDNSGAREKTVPGECCKSLKVGKYEYREAHIATSAIIMLVCVVIVKPLQIMSFVFLVSLLFSPITWQNQQILHDPAEDSAVEKASACSSLG